MTNHDNTTKEVSEELAKAALDTAIEFMAGKINVSKEEMAERISASPLLQRRAVEIANQGISAFFDKHTNAKKEG